jgi:NADPH:quinone reductase-like Zn-dependent oxidoreductase
MKAFHITHPGGLDALLPVNVDEPKCGDLDVIVSMKAWSLNYRDLAMPHGGYIANDKVKTAPPLVPLSDGAGEVVSVGKAVTKWKVGDRVAACFFQDWIDGELTRPQISTALGGAIDGVLAERVAIPEHGLVKLPTAFSYEQAATLPCASVTAWQSLTCAQTKPGQTVLLLGTGGVSIFALQLAKSFGAKVIITSSSDEKLERAKSIGADETINYKAHPDWDQEVLRLTDGEGVDHVLEVGGAGTLAKSMKSSRVSGTLSLIGILSSAAADANPSPLPALFNRLTIRGIYVGSRKMFEDMNRAIEVNKIVPVIDRSFSFEDSIDAYRYLQSAKHFGKVTIVA